jgi:ATP-dependent Zn protease
MSSSFVPRRSYFLTPESSEEDDSSPSDHAKDPALTAAELLLTKGLELADVSLDFVSRDGAVCIVHVANADWVDIFQTLWTWTIRDGRHAHNGKSGRFPSENDWMAWAPMEDSTPSEKAKSSELFAHAVSSGIPVTAFTANVDWLPLDLVRGADCHIPVPLFTSLSADQMVATMFGQPPDKMLTDEQAQFVTPRLLRLARRVGQTATDYVSRLATLIDADCAAMPASVLVKSSASPRIEPTLDRLHGMDEAVAWAQRVGRDLDAFRNQTIGWTDIDRGCLLSGPPGCGKTLFARAMATTLDLPLVSGSYSQWHGTNGAHQGDLLKAMRKTFADARSKVPCILFLDEIDSFPNRGTITHHYAEWEIQVVNGLLSEIDGVDSGVGVILIGACNHPHRLDPALIRSGRLDRHICVSLPDKSALALILREHLGDDLPNEPLLGAALMAAGSTGADCERFVRGARRLAREAGRSMMVSDLLDEIRGQDDRSEQELWRIAVHEAGHAVASCTLQPDTLTAVTLRSDGNLAGAALSKAAAGAYLASTLNLDLVTLLAGRAAEEVILGSPSSGSGGTMMSDLAQATTLAATGAAAYGFDGAAGLLWSGLPEPHTLQKMLAKDPTLGARAGVALDNAYTQALTLVKERRKVVEALADALLEKRALDGIEVALIVALHSSGLPVGAAS